MTYLWIMKTIFQKNMELWIISNGTCRITRLKEQFTISVNMIIIYSYIKIIILIQGPEYFLNSKKRLKFN